MPLYLGDKLISGRSKPIDAEPIENSLNLVTSGGVKKYVDDKVGTGGTISGSGIAIQPEEPSDTDVWIDLDDDETGALSIVTSFNGRDGEVVPEAGDYTAEMVGADPSGSAASALASAKAYADGIKPTKTSQLTNDSGFITGYTETDPTVPAWAKNETKPTYTYSEVGAAAQSHAAQHVSGGSDPITPAAIGALKAYSSFAELGFTESAVTIEGIVNAMENGSALVAQCDTAAYNNGVVPIPYGLMVVHKRSIYFVTFHYSSSSGSWEGHYNFADTSTGPWFGWKKTATTDYALNKAGDTMTGTLKFFADKGSVGAEYSDTTTITYLRSIFGNESHILDITPYGPYYNIGTKTSKWGTNYPILHTGNMNLITPADIGAVNKAGDTMTGNLNITSSGTSTKLTEQVTSGGTVYIGTIIDGKYKYLTWLSTQAGTDSLYWSSNATGVHHEYQFLHTGNTNQTALVATATTPTVNGQINWTYG